MSNWTFEHEEADQEARAKIPAHLDADELIANSWENAKYVSDQIECFKATVDMYIDQDCSSF